MNEQLNYRYSFRESAGDYLPRPGLKVVLTAVLLLGLFLAPTKSSAQVAGTARMGAAQGTVRGVVKDASNGQAIPTATVALWQAADSTLVTGAVADARGGFVLEGLRPGKYYVEVSFIGYKTRRVPDVTLSPQSMQKNLGDVKLDVTTALLDEVQVSAEREFMEVRIDRNVYNTKDQIVADGGSATDVLRGIPALEVDMDGKVSLRGNQNVAVLINGRPSQMSGDMLASFLQGLPASTIERVEVIPNPSARYEPDGMSGIINIVLKKNTRLGIGGSVTAGAGTRGDANAAGMVSYQEGKVNTRLNYGFRRGVRSRSGDRYNVYRFNTPESYLFTSSNGDNTSLSHTLNGNFDYELTDQNGISLSALVSTRAADGTDENFYREYTDPLYQTQYNRFSNEDGNDLNLDLGLAFRHIVDPLKHELVAELRFGRENDSENDAYRREQAGESLNPLVTESERSALDEYTTNASLQVDYVRPLGEDGKIEAGYKGDWERLDTGIQVDVLNSATSVFEPLYAEENSFLYDRQVHAGYGIIGQQFGAIGAQIGVRLEQSLTNFDLSALDNSYDNNYFSVFPSAFMTYKLSDHHSFRMSYSKRINRPRVSGWHNQLNPISDRSDPLFRRVGNPYLKPEYTHATEFTYTLTTKATTISISPYFRRTVDVIRFLSGTDPSGVTTITFENLDVMDAWGAEAISSLRIGDNFNGFASFEVYRVATDAGSLESSLSNNSYGWSTRVNGTMRLTPTLSLQAFLFYRAPMDVEQGRMGSMTRTDLAFRQQFMNNRASLSLRVEDPLNTAGMSMWRETPTSYWENDFRWSGRALNLSFTYNFGKQDRDSNRRRSQSQQDRGDDMGDMGF